MHEKKRKILFIYLLSTCFWLVSCRATPKTECFPTVRPTRAETFVDPLPIVTDIALPAEEKTQEVEFWDVSDVDISDVDPDRKLISFTFDDAPRGYMENLIAVFAAFNEANPDCKASASFFCNGNLINEQSMQTLHAVVAIGSELGNHSYSHHDLTTLSPTLLRSEIENTDALLRRADGKFLHLFRAPYGKLDESVKSQVHAPLIDWTIDTLDWKGKSEDDVYRTVQSEKFSGAIVLMHDGFGHTVSAVKRLLPDLKAEGYQVVSVSKMAKAHDCALKCGSVYIRARKKNP